MTPTLQRPVTVVRIGSVRVTAWRRPGHQGLAAFGVLVERTMPGIAGTERCDAMLLATDIPDAVLALRQVLRRIHGMPRESGGPKNSSEDADGARQTEQAPERIP